MSRENFKANVRLMDIVGYELINDDNIAVAELVKNAIDALAGRVDIVFDGAGDGAFGPGGDARIIVVDNGVGMGRGDIVNKWLNIAYSEKRGGAKDGKIPAGNKGIGRFSCDRLGKFLRLQTGKDGTFLSMNIDWTEFEVDEMGKEIGSVKLDLRGIQQRDFGLDLPASVSRAPSHGVILEMTGLRGKWDRKKILVLRRLLEKMVNPHDSLLANPRCQIYTHASGLGEGLTGPIKNRIFDKLGFETTSAESRIAEDGRRIETEIRDRGRMVAKVTVEGDVPPYPALGGARVSLHYMNRYKKAMFKRATGVATLDFGSVFLFLNGFRVLPYGNRGDDWLSLDNRKTQGMRRFLGARDLLGRIELCDPKGDHFRVMSSREGVVDNQAYRQLVNVDRSGARRAAYGGYFYDVLGRLEAYVVEGLVWDSLGEGIRDEEIERMLDEGGEERYKLGRGEKDLRILGALRKIVAPPERGEIIGVEIDPLLLPKLREEERKRAEKIVAHLGKLSDKGVLAVDQAQALADIREHIEKQDARIHAAEERAEKSEEDLSAERVEKKFYRVQVSPDRKEELDMTHELSTKVKTLKKGVETLNALLGNSAPDGVRDMLRAMRRGAEESYSLCHYVVTRDFKDAYKADVHDIPKFLRIWRRIRLGRDKFIGEIRLPPKGEVVFASKFSPMRLTMVLDNLLDNARKTAKMRFGAGRKPNIRVEASVAKDEQELILRVSDDAGGLDDSIKNPDNIFKMGFTRTGGMGMGLRIVREIIEEKMGGKIWCVPRSGGTMFEIHIPKR